MSAVKLNDQLVIAISSRALFDLDDANSVYEQQGTESYANYQIAHEKEILKPGVAFPLVQKLLNLNQQSPCVEVILLSRNSADTGLRIFNSIDHHQLNIVRAAFTNGQSPYRYAKAFAADLFLSTNPADVRDALTVGCAAATLIPKAATLPASHDKIKIAFDGDSVLFSDEAERIYKKEGLEAFTASEKKSAATPLPGGPFKGFLSSLQALQQRFAEHDCPIHTALVTARQAPAHERMIRTLRAWNIRLDETLFLGGLSKGEFLGAFQADIFFDDQTVHCQSAEAFVTCGHVPYGIANEETSER